MRITLHHLIFILPIILTLQGCIAHQTLLTAAQLKGPAVKIQLKKLAQTPPQACADIKPLLIPAPHYSVAAEKAGILPDDFLSLHQTVSALHITLTVRDVNQNCAPYLRIGLASKGHDVLTKTFTAESLPTAYKYLAGTVSTLDKKPKVGEQIKDPLAVRYLTKDGNPLTCDYDLMDVAQADGERITGESNDDLDIRTQLNQNLPWRGQPPEPVIRIMHGAQAEYSNYLRATADKHSADEKPILSLNQPEVPLTAFTFKGDIYRLEHLEELFNFYRCHEIAIPDEWNIQY